MIQNLNSKANSEEVDFLFISFEFVSEMRYICLLLNRSHVLSGENDNAGATHVCKLAFISLWGNGLSQWPQVPLLIASCFFQRKFTRVVFRCLLTLRKRTTETSLREREKRLNPFFNLAEKKKLPQCMLLLV